MPGRNILDHYTASWARTSQDGTYDTGGRWHTEWDVGGAFSWSENSLFFDALNRVYEQTGIYDDGRSWQTQWDIGDSEIWSKQVSYQDAADALVWTEQSLRYDDLNRLYDQTGTYDDGRTWHVEWDVADVQTWSKQVSYQDATDVLVWTEQSLRYDDLNRLYDQTGTYDDARTWHVEWDVADVQTWSKQVSYQDAADTFGWTEQSLRYDDLNRLYDQTGTYDDGRTWHVEWDVADVQTWSKQVSYQDAADVLVWTEQSLRYDDLNRLYDQTGTYDDGRTWHSEWDIANTESWHSRATIMDAADNYGWAQLIYEYDASGNVLTQTTIDDTVL